jgi:hypothetical protein
LSRVVSTDFVACECLCFGCICERSARSARADFFGVGSRWAACSVMVSYETLFDFAARLRILARGLFGRSFLLCDRASTRPFVDAREPLITSALGRDSPDTDKICPIVLRDSSPLHNQDYAWPTGQVKGTRRAGREPQGFARYNGESTPSQKPIGFLRHVVANGILGVPDAEDRATVGTDPSTAPGLGEE